MNLTEPRGQAAARRARAPAAVRPLAADGARGSTSRAPAAVRASSRPSGRAGWSTSRPPSGRLRRAFATSRRLGLGASSRSAPTPLLPGRGLDVGQGQNSRARKESSSSGGAPASTFGSLLLAVPDDDGALRYAGRVGSGFTDRQLTEIAARLEPLERETSPRPGAARGRGGRWVERRRGGRACAVDPDGRLRHARWRGWRPDRSPEDVRREA